jgi:acyl-CoA thioester hydrolase
VTDSRTYVHTSFQSVRWGDMDAFQHVNNTVYFRYMEQARLEWLFALHARIGAMDPDVGAVIVNASCDFLLPLVYPADIEVRMFLGKPGRSSINSYYDIHLGERKYAQGASKIVWISRSTGRSIPLPAELVSSLEVRDA